MTEENVNSEESLLTIEDSVVNCGDQNMGLADFLDVDVSEIDANEGFEILPQGIYKFSTSAIKVNTTTRKDMTTGEEFKVPNIALCFVVDEVVDVKNFDGDIMSLVNRRHSEFISLPTFDNERMIKAVGRLKALVYAITGLTKEDDPLAKIPDALRLIANKSFTAKIKHGSYEKKSGETVTTADLDLKSIKPAE